MGGHGSGGLRPGSGRRTDYVDVGGEETLVDVPVPDGLNADATQVWQELAPYARDKRTLKPETARRFRLLCEAIVLEQKMRSKIEEDGFTYVAVTVDGAGQERQSLKAHPLCGPQRGMMQRIETGMLAFRLAPDGR